MTFSSTVMLRETREEGIFYWECTHPFVQMKLGRFVQELYNIKGKVQTRSIPYSDSKMYLPPLNIKPKKEEPEEKEPDIDEDLSGEFVSYAEESLNGKEND